MFSKLNTDARPRPRRSAKKADPLQKAVNGEMKLKRLMNAIMEIRLLINVFINSRTITSIN